MYEKENDINIGDIIKYLGIVRKHHELRTGMQNENWNKMIAALDSAIEILRKQIPKILKKERTPVGKYRCPNCNVAFIEGTGKTNYCGNCGQKLDWEGNK